jgi:hypothetical protein
MTARGWRSITESFLRYETYSLCESGETGFYIAKYIHSSLEMLAKLPGLQPSLPTYLAAQLRYLEYKYKYKYRYCNGWLIRLF